MDKKIETTLRELLNIRELKSDVKLRGLIESLLKELKRPDIVSPALVDHLDLKSHLKRGKEPILPDLHDLDFLKRILKRIEGRIDDLLDKLVCLLKDLRNKSKSKKQDPSIKKQILKLLLQLINLLNIKSLIEKLHKVEEKIAEAD
ncbi:hypothetical protein [Evansella cellulosilytica]|uniref:Uncharacterized protein n=1 Tax=Evansella cellulosilytica (strain ATCC 21833 / DSM 2522 / FERM P-1141 / JCM 9156 / N-4) TaxID=649639 RepID=E6TQB9_EVAC2|nr:hypothetical protein [Evansella cellulosilytica]ADU29297.1 hypothetical protein Bcell_1024 [Evansella cellulosilytica DSM 2522]